MRNIILTIIFSISLTSLFAQTWPPIGAKWTYSHHASFYPYLNEPRTIECIGDTIIGGKSCRILLGNCICGYDVYETYLYHENGKVFMYSDSSDAFNILYDFSAGPGDSWTLIPPISEFGDSTVITVNAVGIEVINGDTLNIQHIQNEMYSAYEFPSYIIENIGCYFCFYPLHATCDPWTGPIRCYEDTNGLIKFTDLPCDTVIYYSINENPLNDVIKVFPNPANTKFFIEIDEMINIQYSVLILSTNGQNQIYKTSLKNDSEINIEKLKQGFYFIQLEFEDGQVAVKKIIKE